MDPDDRVFVATLLLAGGIGVVVVTRAWLGALTMPVTWLVFGLIALMIFADLVFDTGASRRIARWLNQPLKGPARWRGKPR